MTRVLPDGCIDVLWLDERLIVAGPDTTAHLEPAPPTSIAALRFAPGVGPALLGVPAYELVDLRVRLDAVWPSAEVRRLSEQLAASPDPGRLLQRAVADRLSRTPPDPLMRGVARRLAGGASVERVAQTAGLSPRQLHRRSLTAFGYGPKTLSRILRLVRALDLARSGLGWSGCADHAGYADQAHLARDVRALTGATLSSLFS